MFRGGRGDAGQKVRPILSLCGRHRHPQQVIDQSGCSDVSVTRRSPGRSPDDHSTITRKITRQTPDDHPTFKSYLSDRCQFMFANDVSSTSTAVSSGVPQGSGLGPPLFSLYTFPQGKIMIFTACPEHIKAEMSRLWSIFHLCY